MVFDPTDTARSGGLAGRLTPGSSFMRFDRRDLEGTLTARFERQARRFPGRIAIRSARAQLTYGELLRAAACVALGVRAAGNGPLRPVALLLSSEVHSIVALLGVLKAGGFCVCLDPATAAARNRRLLEEVQPPLLITDEETACQAADIARSTTRIVSLEEWLAVAPAPAVFPDLPAGSLAVVSFTSGSTGQPKGVLLTHRFLLHLVMCHTNSRCISSDDRLSALTRCHHIAGLSDAFRALLNGATLLPYDLSSQTSGGLVPWLIEERVTILHCVPSLFRVVVDLLPPGETLPSLRLIHLGGESVTRRDVELYRARFSDDCILVNNLGSSETGPLGESFLDKTTPVRGELVPVVMGVEDKDIFLVDETGSPVRDGAVGEIAVRSRYISPGYWSDPVRADPGCLPAAGSPERTFLTGDLGRCGDDGLLTYVGRKDNRVKIRGYRVDLTEVEASMRNAGVCADVAVLARPSAQAEMQLVAFVVPRSDGLSSARPLRAILREHLPSYMVPTEVVMLAALPLTSTGKVDRQALAAGKVEPGRHCGEGVSPRDEYEGELLQMWETLLGVSVKSVRESFLDVGGSSLLVLQLSWRMEQQWGVRVSMSAIFDHPTIEDLAGLVRRLRTQSDG